MKPMKIAAIVPAAGIGSRMQSVIPKQYLTINQKSILEHTLARLACVSEIDQICVAISPDDMWFGDIKLDPTRFSQVLGGKERADTVFNALIYLKDQGYDWVLVHDAARPLVKVDDIKLLMTQCIAHNQGGILAAKVKDTIKRGGTCIEETVPRDDLWQALTPQMFKPDELYQALYHGIKQSAVITDEASAMELSGHQVMLVSGRSDNIKITTPEDLALAEFYLKNSEDLEKK